MTPRAAIAAVLLCGVLVLAPIAVCTLRNTIVDGAHAYAHVMIRVAVRSLVCDFGDKVLVTTMPALEPDADWTPTTGSKAA